MTTSTSTPRVDTAFSADSGRLSVIVSGFGSVADGRAAAAAVFAEKGKQLGDGWAVRESASYPACMVYAEAR